MTASLVLLVLVVTLLALRVNLIVVLIVFCAYIHMVWGQGELVYIIEDMWVSIDKEVLLSIPLFLLMGVLMGRGNIAARLIAFVSELTAPLPGGLAVATILSCAIFAAISGSSTVTLIAVGSILYPSLLSRGYSKSFSLGTLCVGGTLGVIIPPSIPMILFGIATETSIVDLFTAGILPGLLLAVLLSLYALVVNWNVPRRNFSMSRCVSAAKEAVWAGLLPVILLGGIYSGYFSPTESAAVALVYALLVETLVYRDLKLKDLYNSVIETTTMIGTLFPILAVATSLNLLLTSQRVPIHLTDWVSGFIVDPITFILVINVMLLLVGMVMDMVSAILILAPILVVLGRNYGIDPVHLGIIMTVNLEIGLITAPVGMNLIVAMTAFREKFMLIVRGSLPYVFVMIVGLLIISFVPSLSLMLVR
ncbi:TRAP transporter large permease [Ruegeria pomeroyi]|nr:TRAP transporter large permease [Ruegeria pomeroyi]